MTRPRCSELACDRAVHARGQCHRHYKKTRAREVADGTADDGIVDRVAVERALQGDPTVTLTRRERAAAVAALAADGATRTGIARRLRLSAATVNRLLDTDGRRV